MERKIGEVFEYNGILLKVVKPELNRKSCDGCYFEGKLCVRDGQVTGPCLYRNRRDESDVIFKKQHE